jgi:hypothetical protein
MNSSEPAPIFYLSNDGDTNLQILYINKLGRLELCAIRTVEPPLVLGWKLDGRGRAWAIIYEARMDGEDLLWPRVKRDYAIEKMWPL